MKSLKNTKEEVCLKRNSRVEYGPDCLKILVEEDGLDTIIENNLVRLVNSKTKKYFDKHPIKWKQYCEKYKDRFGFYPQKNYTKPFPVTRRKEVADFIEKNRRK